MRHRFQRALRADRDKGRGFYRPVRRRYLAHSRQRAFRLVQDFEREERFRGVRGEVGAVVVSSRQRSAAKKNTIATTRTRTTSIREEENGRRGRRRGDGSFGQTNRRRRRRRCSRRGDFRCCCPQREAHFREKEKSEREQKVKKAKKFKKFSSLSRTFFKEREKRDIFAKLFFTIKKKRALSHTQESAHGKRASRAKKKKKKKKGSLLFLATLSSRGLKFIA